MRLKRLKQGAKRLKRGAKHLKGLNMGAKRLKDHEPGSLSEMEVLLIQKKGRAMSKMEVLSNSKQEQVYKRSKPSAHGSFRTSGTFQKAEDSRFK